MIIHREDFFRQPAPVQIGSQIDNRIHDASGRFMREGVIHKLRTAACLDKMIKADARNPFLFQQPENFRHFGDIAGV